MLVELGWDVRQATNGAEGLAELERGGLADLVLVDWQMEVMDGDQLVRELRRRRAWSAMRLVVVSTDTDAAKILAALTAGADEFMMKPFTLDMLRDKLALLGLAEPSC